MDQQSSRRGQTATRPRLLSALCTVGGLGRLLPRGGGTLGALAALPLGWALSPLHWGLRLAVVAALTVLCTAVVQAYVTRAEKKDPQEVVLDELVGCLIALQFAAWRLDQVLIAFALFRLFDIAKPWPIGLVDRRVGGGLGVMLDDVLAGLFAGLLTLASRAVL